MKKIGLIIIVFGLTLSSCNQNKNTTSAIDNPEESALKTEELLLVDNVADTIEVQNLIRQVLKWAASENTIHVLPVITDENDSVYVGFDLNKLENNCEKLTNTNLFSKEFIDNYSQIILILDKKIKSNDFEYGPWLVGDLPPFRFCNDANPWCLCQDHMDWNLVTVEQIEGNDFQWKWGGLSEDTHQS